MIAAVFSILFLVCTLVPLKDFLGVGQVESQVPQLTMQRSFAPIFPKCDWIFSTSYKANKMVLIWPPSVKLYSSKTREEYS